MSVKISDNAESELKALVELMKDSANQDDEKEGNENEGEDDEEAF